MFQAQKIPPKPIKDPPPEPKPEPPIKDPVSNPKPIKDAKQKIQL